VASWGLSAGNQSSTDIKLDSAALTECIKNILSGNDTNSKKALFTLSNVLTNRDIASESGFARSQGFRLSTG
jgi:hypothetical protein